MAKTLSQILCALVIIVLATLLLNPFHIGMADMMHMTLTAGLLAAFGIFVAFVLSEQGGDERERSHRMFSGRAGFLTGALVLVAGIVYQGSMGAIDPWLVGALALMLVIRISAHLYSDWRQ
jgi:uncharacterized membrane protein